MAKKKLFMWTEKLGSREKVGHDVTLLRRYSSDSRNSDDAHGYKVNVMKLTTTATILIILS